MKRYGTRAGKKLDEMFAEDGIAHGLAGEGGEPLRGTTGFKPFFRKFWSAFPDIEVVVEDTVTEGEKVAARGTVRGKHQSDNLGFAATQQPMKVTGITIVRA